MAEISGSPSPAVNASSSSPAVNASPAVNSNRKRCRADVEELGEVSEVSHPSPNAKIHGIVSMVSPMKESKKCSYFDGELTDGKSSLRFFGFDSGVRRKLLDAEESSKPVALVDCEVKRSRLGQDLEVF